MDNNQWRSEFLYNIVYHELNVPTLDLFTNHTLLFVLIQY